MLISIVIPVYNEAAGIRDFHSQLFEVVKNIKTHYEIIYVNDGSHDDTLKLLHEISSNDNAVKVINLSRNFGKEIATTAGIHHAKGDATILMDGDGQHPPSLIPSLLKEWEQGSQVVIGVRRTSHHEGLVKKYGSKLFYRLFNIFSNTEITPQATDFRLLDKSVRQEFNRFTERHRITRGLIDWMGFTRSYITFDSPERIAGTASYSVWKLVQLALNSFVSLSLKPLFFVAWTGAAITGISLILGLFVVIEQLILGDPLSLNVTGSAMIGILILFLVGVILSSQGIVAIYLSHVHSQTQARPLFIVDMQNSVNL